MERQEYRVREIIFKENDLQNGMYSICEGSVDIYSGYGTADAKKICTLTEGQFFGEIGMISAIPRTATAVAAEDKVVLERIKIDDFGDYLKEHPENLQEIMSSVSRRIRDLTEDMVSFTMMTNELLRIKDGKKAEPSRISEMINGLLANLKEKKAQRNEFSMMQKRQKALAGEVPPVLHYAAGNVIFREGDAADCMYEICYGSVGIYSDYQMEYEKLLTTLYADSVFGEMGILDNMPRSATAVCLTDCTVKLVKPEHFMQFFQTKPEKILNITNQMCKQLRNLTQTYLQVCKELEQMPAPEEDDFHEEEVLAKLDYIRERNLCSCMYDISPCADYWYDHF